MAMEPPAPTLSRARCGSSPVRYADIPELESRRRQRQMSDLRIETVTYKEADRQRWRSGNDEMFQKSSASPFLKRVLGEKHRVRPKRFFGEAFVAAHMRHEESYYCSFKWLTASAWADSSDLAARESAEFKRALATHFPRLGELQARAMQFARTLGGRKPVAPDLWLVVNGEHRFIEVKLAKDEVAPHQFAGLALLAKCLPSEQPVSVTVVNLDSGADQFNEYANRLTA